MTSLLLFVFLLAPDAAYGQTLQEYRIGPGDKLNITVFGHQDLSVVSVVDGSGQISLPLIGSIPANSKTLSQLQREITEALNKDYFNRLAKQLPGAGAQYLRQRIVGK